MCVKDTDKAYTKLASGKISNCSYYLGCTLVGIQQLVSARFAAFLITPVFVQKSFSLLVYSYVALVYRFLLYVVSSLNNSLLYYIISLVYYIYLSHFIISIFPLFTFLNHNFTYFLLYVISFVHIFTLLCYTYFPLRCQFI